MRRGHASAACAAAALMASGVVIGRSAAATATPWADAMAAYLHTRHVHASVAVYDYVARRWDVYDAAGRFIEASIVKVDVLETLLHRRDGSLTARQRTLATAMIERSDNAAAQALYVEAGGYRGLAAYNALLPLPATTMNAADYWGLSTTGSRDQVTLVRRLVERNAALTDAARSYALGLMHGVVPAQRWGVPRGVPAGVYVANKNGWLPVRNDLRNWSINSIGYVSGQGRRYAVAILTSGNPSMADGVATVNRVAALAWRFAAVARPAPPPVPTPMPTPTVTAVTP